MSYIRAPFFRQSVLLVHFGLALLGSAVAAQPDGFLTPVASNSFLHGLSVQANQRFKSITLPQQGLVFAAVANSAGTMLYTANNFGAGNGAEVVVSSLPAGTTVATIPLTFTPYSLLLSPNGTQLYVAGTTNFTSARLSIIDTTANSVSTTLSFSVTPDPSAAFPMAITPDGANLYLAAGGLVRVHTATLGVKTFSSPGAFSQGIAITPDGSQLWLGIDNVIQVRNATTMAQIATIAAPGANFGGNGLWITPDGSQAILANNGLRAFDTSTFLQTASVTASPFIALGYIAPGPDTGSFLVTNTSGSLVLRVTNSLTLVASYPQSGAATVSIALPGGQEILAANGNVTAVGTVNSQTGVLGPSIPVGCQAGVPAINVGHTSVYVPDRCSQDVTILSTLAQPASRVLHGPVFATKVLVSPDDSRVYGADLSGIKYSGAGTIEILDTASGAVIGTLTGSLTVDAALSANGAYLYIDDNGSSGSGFDCPVGGVCVFDTGTLTLAAQIPNVFGLLAISQDGKSLYVGPDGGSLWAINTASFSATPVSLPVTLQSFGAVAVSPLGTSAVVFGNTAAGGAGFVLDTGANQLTGAFPVPDAHLSSAAFAPDGNSIWFVTGTAPSVTLVQESFPGGQVLAQTPAEGTTISFTAQF